MIRLAIIGTGGMARTHAKFFKEIPNVTLVACCDVMAGRAEEFAKAYAIPAAYTDMAKMFDEVGIDAVTVVTSDAYHAPVSLAALKRGKHVLCEKPLAPNFEEALAMAEAAKAAGTINMVNFSYRNSSAIHAAADMIARGEIGEVRHVEARYLQSWLASNHWGDWRENSGWLWRLSTKHGSKGVLGDIGVHIVDFASYPVGEITSVQARLKTFDKAPGNKVGEYDLDANDSALLMVEFANGAVGTITTTRYAFGHENSVGVAIYGDNGAIRIDLDKSYTSLERTLKTADHKYGPWEKVDTGDSPNIYQRFVSSVESGVNDQPDFARGAAIQKILDASEEASVRRAAIDLAEF